MTQTQEKRYAAVIVAVFIVLAVTFSFGPIFEGPDELEHYNYIRILVETRALPDPNLPWGEVHQAPLYYLLAAPLSALFDDPDFEWYEAHRNPFYPYEMSVPGNDNKNIYLHPRAEAFPYTDAPTARGIHVLRLFSVLIGLGSVLASYATFHLLWPERPTRRLLALGFVAFLPQFTFMSSVVSNDTLLYFWTTLALYLLVRQTTKGPSWRLAALLGLVFGGALLTEISALFLVFPAAVAVLSDWRRMWRFAVVTVLVTLAVAGWWYVRNLILHGDLTGVQALAIEGIPDAIQGGRPVFDVGLYLVTYAYRGAWARFGFGAVRLSEPLYLIQDLLVLVTVAGMIVIAARLIRRPEFRPTRLQIRQWSLMWVFALAWVAALIYWSATVWSGNQGRFLLTSTANWGAFFALAVTTLTPARLHMPVTLSTVAALLTVLLIALFGFFFPAYEASAVPETIEHPLALRYGDVAELIGIAPPTAHTQPGEVITITLYWRALAATDIEWQPYLHTTGSEIVRRDSYPATGNLLATDWQPGDSWAEEYVIRIPEDAPTQVTYPLVAGLYNPETDTALDATTPDGTTVTPYVGRLVINGEAVNADAATCFGEGIGLQTPQLTLSQDTAELCLSWIARGTTAADLQVFVHVVDADGNLLTQADHTPRAGQYPTDVWVAGELIEDCVSFALPEAEDWQIQLGLYDLASALRVPASQCEADPLPGDYVVVTPTR